MKCWKCDFEQFGPSPGQKLSFRSLCESCQAWLHCCKNCKNYKPGLPNDCLVRGTECIADREAINYCEEFDLLGSGKLPTGDVHEVFNQLFQQETNPFLKEPKNPKETFGSLFKNE